MPAPGGVQQQLTLPVSPNADRQVFTTPAHSLGMSFRPHPELTPYAVLLTVDYLWPKDTSASGGILPWMA